MSLQSNEGPFSRIFYINGKRILTITVSENDADTCQLWNTADGKKIATYWVERHLHGSRAISADGTKIALEEPDHAIMI